MTRATFHEHAGKIAIKLDDAETVFLSPKMAAAISRELAHAAYQVNLGFHYAASDIEQ
jgi:hypothetical protein